MNSILTTAMWKRHFVMGRWIRWHSAHFFTKPKPGGYRTVSWVWGIASNWPLLPVVSKYRLRDTSLALSHVRCNKGSRDRRVFPPIFKGIWKSPCTALMEGCARRLRTIPTRSQICICFLHYHSEHGATVDAGGSICNRVFNLNYVVTKCLPSANEQFDTQHIRTEQKSW